MNWRQIAEVCFGLVHEGRHPATLYRPEWFPNPYDSGIELWQKKGSTKEDVAKVVDGSYLADASNAVHKYNGLGEYQNFDWSKALQNAYMYREVGQKLQKVGKQLENNEPVEILPIYGQLTSLVSSQSNGLVLAKDVKYGEYKPFKKCGYAPIDNTLGGIPSDGPIIIYGLTGVGKSTIATAIISGLLNLYPEDTAAVYTLEMGAEHWMYRSMNMFPKLKKVLDRLFVSGSVKDIEELVAEVTAKRVNYVVIDDMDNIVRSSDASEYERVYRRVKEICRFMNIPVFVLGQPNRLAKMAVGNGERFLSPYDVAWSGAAENSAALLMAVQVANSLDMKSEEYATTDANMQYLIYHKSRDGWPSDRDPRAMKGPGAVILEHSPDWNGKPYGDKWRIWPKDSGGQAIGAKKSKKKSED